MAELEFWVDGMSCAHCARAVTAELSALDGVDDVRVDVVSGRVQVTHDAPLLQAVVAQAIHDAGYELRFWPADLHD